MEKKSTIAISKECVLKLKTIVDKMNEEGMLMTKGRYVELLIKSFGERFSAKLIENTIKENNEFKEKLMKWLNEEYKGENV